MLTLLARAYDKNLLFLGDGCESHEYRAQAITARSLEDPTPDLLGHPSINVEPKNLPQGIAMGVVRTRSGLAMKCLALLYPKTRNAKSRILV